ncbi:MAG: sigma 54-interacting transcriptional regulator, partial [Desulfovibrionales bacterium]|nr:sigma 54-interacting transcriptional regulator [Desulfovibrionales bacterium]
RESLERAMGEILSQDRGGAQFTLEIACGKRLAVECTLCPFSSDSSSPNGVMLILKEAAPQFIEFKPFISDRKLLEALPEGVVTINAKFQIASFNRTAEKITGYTREEALGKHCWDIFRANLCDNGCLLKEAIERGYGELRRQVRIQTKEGRPQCILANTGVLRDDQGLIVGAVETFREEVAPPVAKAGKKKEKNPFQIIGRSRAMKTLFEMLPDIAASDANVFITGESGTGKNLFARTIHQHSRRSALPFVPVNCSALAETLLESELFGHEKSAFTGADRMRQGRFEQVRGGSLFLDEIGELKPGLQVKLLRVLDHKKFERVGGSIPIDLDARIITATNRDLSRLLEEGGFRQDFFYRLRTVPIDIPPLREREGDIPLLVDHFIRRFNTQFHKKVKGVSPEVMDIFCTYHWPGNVRELARVIEHAFVFVKGDWIQGENLPRGESFMPKPVPPRGPRADREAVIQALQKSQGRKKEAADILGISRTSLGRRMKSLGLSA